MVVSTIQQPPSTYLTWTKFKYPHPDLGPITAFAVPTPTYKYIQNGYALMSTIMVVNLWAIVMVCGIYKQLTTPRAANKVNGMTMTLWNTRDAPRQSAIGAILYARKKWNKWWYYPFILILAGAWIASLAAGIFLPSSIFLGNAAPVNPLSIYVPTGNFSDWTMQDTYSIWALEGGPYLRATAAALVASDEVRAKVKVSLPVLEGTWNNTRSGVPDESIQRIDYGYNVTGTDLGLQNLPQLVLTVAGSCVTDYTWLNVEESKTLPGDPNNPVEVYHQDYYQSPWQSDPMWADGASSSVQEAAFCFQDPTLVDNRGNISWGVVISSVDHFSVTPSKDPWYRTSDSVASPDGNVFRILPGRPALSCWQNDVWSYKGQSTDVTNLQSILPPDTLSNATADILARYLGLPAVVNLGPHIGTSALQSAQGTISGVFDAGASSIYKDLSPLILGAYIATINTLADTTLYFDHNSTNSSSIRNLAREEDDDSITRPDVGQFIVFSEHVASLSLTLIILIPFLTLGSWLLMYALLEFTPLKLTKAMEPTELLRAVKGQFGEPTLYIDHDGKEKWKFNTGKISNPKRAKKSSSEFLTQPLHVTDDDNISHYHMHMHTQTRNQDDEPGTQLVSITAPRIDIPLLSPLSASHSFNFGRRDTNVSRQTSAASQRDDGFFEEHGIEHMVGTNRVSQHRPLMGFSDTTAGGLGIGLGVGLGGGGGGYQPLTDEEESMGMGMTTTGRPRLRPVSPLEVDESGGGRVSRASFR